jgi:hypothetical protein
MFVRAMVARQAEDGRRCEVWKKGGKAYRGQLIDAEDANELRDQVEREHRVRVYACQACRDTAITLRRVA